jgi:hypothetical protein
VDVSRRGVILAVAAALLIPILGQLVVPLAEANIDVHVRSFGNGSFEALIAFPAAGTNNTFNLSFQTGMRVMSAFFNVSGLAATPGGTDCPESPSIDLGGDDTPEWRFNGTGYGRLGHQNIFSDGNASASIVFGPSGGTDSSVSIRLPVRGAISTASVRVTPSAFVGPLNVSLDVGADGLADWVNTAMNSETTIPALESVLSAYISSTAPTGTDPFNISYVDVPLRISCGSAATLVLSDLSINYSCTFVTRDLASALDQLIPDALGSDNVSVQLKVSSASPGKLRIWDLRIKAQPPSHSTSLLDPHPAPDPAMDENTSLEFSVSPVDIYGNPFSLQWSVDDLPVPGALGPAYNFSANFSSSGRHMVMVAATNGLSESQITWSVNVRDVDRPPVLDSFSPSTTASVAEESTLVFNVSAHDPDGDQLSYSWKLDGRQRPDVAGSMSYHPTYGSVGQHTVDVTVSDGRGLWASQEWCVTVLKTNVPPAISSFYPQTDATIREGDTLRFSIAATDINADILSYGWAVDGFHVADGMEFNYSTDFGSSGSREIRAVVTDGEFTVIRSWNITVQDVNRPPVAVLGSPAEGSEFLDTDLIRLAAPQSSDPDMDILNLSWSDGDVVVGNGTDINISLARGRHILRLVVDDGKGGRDTVSVNITVRTIRLGLTAKASQPTAVIGGRVKVTACLVGEGDAPARNLTLDFFVDGVPSGSHSVVVLEPGANITRTFIWTAERGSHEILVVAGDSTITIKLKGVEAISEWFYPILILLVALTLSVGTAAGYFTYLSLKGPLARPRRAKRTLKTPWYWLGTRISEVLERIRVEGTPFRDQPLDIQTQVPEGVTTEYLVSQQLTARRKWWLKGRQHDDEEARRILGAPEAPTKEPAPQDPALASPATSNVDGAFSSSTGPVPEPVEEGQAAPEVQPSAREKEEPAGQKKPRKRIKDIEDRILALERKGSDVASVRRFLSLGRSFWKGGNTAKAEQYFDKAEIRLHELEEDVRGIPLCPSCGATVDPAWTVCPECETKLQ